MLRKLLPKIEWQKDARHFYVLAPHCSRWKTFYCLKEVCSSYFEIFVRFSRSSGFIHLLCLKFFAHEPPIFFVLFKNMSTKYAVHNFLWNFIYSVIHFKEFKDTNLWQCKSNEKSRENLFPAKIINAYSIKTSTWTYIFFLLILIICPYSLKKMQFYPFLFTLRYRSKPP